LRALEPTIRASLRTTDSRRARADALQRVPSAEYKSWTKHGVACPEADIAVDLLLRRRLPADRMSAGFRKKRTTAQLGGSRLWIVDPIDGTRFMSTAARLGDLGRWSRTAARSWARSSRRWRWAVSQPRQRGATRGGVPCERQRHLGRRARRAETDAGRACKITAGIVLGPKVHSLALRLARVADGRLDIAFASRTAGWDLAAADLIVHEAGGAGRAGGQTHVYNSAPRATAHWSLPDGRGIST
jgi:myo-inositol-1(or 4)-monophosphatase